MPEPQSPFKRVRRKFSQEGLKRVCEMHELDFPEAYDMGKWLCRDQGLKDEYEEFYAFKDNGSSILAVAHLDTVMPHSGRKAGFVTTAAGPVVYSGALDDRLGAYTILELLPKLGVTFDWLLTTGEESGRSTAQYFDAPKEYQWMIEFDRGGTDVVMYQYDDGEMRQLVRDSGAKPADGIFSDISYMEHLEIKGFNWGVGYRDYHGPRSHAFLEDYWMMIGYFLKFYEANKDAYLPHEKTKYGRGHGYSSSSWWGGGSYSWDDDDVTTIGTRALSSSSDDDTRWWDDDDLWTDAHWDAYVEGGVDAVKALGPPEALEIILDGEVVSEEFDVVQAALELEAGESYKADQDDTSSEAYEQWLKDNANEQVTENA